MVTQRSLRSATLSSKVTSQVNKQIQKQVVKPTETEAATNTAEYKKYQQEVKEYNNWQRAISLVFRGKGYAAKGDPELEGKVRQLERMQSAQIQALYKQGVPLPPTMSGSEMSYIKDLEDYNKAVNKQIEKQNKQAEQMMSISPELNQSKKIPDYLNPNAKQPTQQELINQIFSSKAVVTQPSIDLNINNTSKKYETKIPTGAAIVSASGVSSDISKDRKVSNVSTRVGNGFWSNAYNRVRDFVTGSGGYKKGYQDEIYSDGGFVSASEASGQATGYWRPTTIKEAEKIKEAQQSPEKIPIIGDVIKQNRLLQEKLENRKQIVSEFEKGNFEKAELLGGKILNSTSKDKEGNEQTTYNLLGENVNVGGYQIPIERLDTSDSFLGGSTFKTAYRASGIFLGEKFRELAEKTKTTTTTKDEKKFNIYLDETTQYDNLGNVSPRQIIIPKGTTTESYIINPKVAKFTGSLVGEGSQYFIPYGGTALFAGDVIKAGERVDFNPIKFIKEEPGMALALGTVGAVKAIGWSSKVLRTSKTSKYLSEAEATERKLSNDFVKNVIVENRNISRGRFTSTDDVLQSELFTTKKGKITTTGYYPKKTMTGKITEVRKTGFFGKPKIYEGVGEYSDDIFKEVMYYDKGIKKITEINRKTGLGSVTLLKGDKILFKSKVGLLDVADDLTKFGKNKELKYKIDKQFDNPLTITELEATSSTGKKLKSRRIRTREGDEIIFLDDISSAGLESSKRVEADIRTRINRYKNPSNTRFRLTSETSGYTDIIEVGQRKGLLRFNTNDRNILLKSQAGQKIEFGIDKSSDIILTSSSEKAFSQVKKISPKVTRDIKDIYGTNIVDISLKQGSKSQKAIQFAERARIKAAKEYYRKADLIDDIIKENIKIQDDFEKALKIQEPKSKSINIIKDNKNPKLDTKDLTQNSESIYSFNNLETTTYVPKATEYLSKNKPNINIPETFETTLGENIITPQGISLISPKVSIQTIEPKTSVVTSYNIQNEELKPTLKINTDISQKILSATKLNTKSFSKSLIRQEINPEIKQLIKNDIKLDTKQASAVKTKLETKLNTRQQIFQRQSSTQQQRQNKEEVKTTKTKIPITLKQSISKLNRIQNNEGNVFEAVGIRFGKEVSLLKGTKSEVSRKLSKFLSGTLGASGFLKESNTGRKLKAEETGLLENFGYRKSKVNPFLVVEKQSRRLKKGGGEVGEIQMFKKKSKKKSNSLGL